MTTPQKLPLADALDCAHAYTVLKNGSYRLKLSTTPSSFKYTSDEFAAVDTRLPQLLSYLCDTLRLSPHLTAECVRATRRHWLGKPLLEQSRQYAALGLDTLCSLRAPLDTYECDRDLLIGTGYVYRLAAMPGGIEVACSVENHQHIMMSRQWLESWYPGSSARITTGLALEMDDVALVTYAFQEMTQTMPLMVLPDLLLTGL